MAVPWSSIGVALDFLGVVFLAWSSRYIPTFMPSKLVRGCWPWSKGAYANSVGGAKRSDIGWGRLLRGLAWPLLLVGFAAQFYGGLD